MVNELEEEDCDDHDDKKLVISSKDGVVTYIIKRVLCALKQKDQTQWSKIFQAKC